MVESRKVEAEAKGVSLGFSGESAHVAVSPVILRLVASNLLDNALKFTEAGGSVEVSVAVHGADLVLSVSDTGVGIPEAETHRIFERFYRWTEPGRDQPGRRLRPGNSQGGCREVGWLGQGGEPSGEGPTFWVTWPGAVVHG